MSRSITPRDAARDVAEWRDPNRTDVELQRLDQYEAGYSEEELRLDALGTISAGWKEPNDKGQWLPHKSTDGTIRVNGRSTPDNLSAEDQARLYGLISALREHNFKRLTIAFPYNNPLAFVQQNFRRYSASALEIYGDDQEVVVLTEGRRRVHQAGSPEYAAAVATCSVNTSIYFALARWTEDGQPEVYFPDGAGLYRIRCTSRNTPRILGQAIKQLREMTHGAIAGVPFDCWIEQRDVVDKLGKRHLDPVWRFAVNPPFELTTRTLVPMLQAGVATGERLALPVPRLETLEDATKEGPDGSEAEDAEFREMAPTEDDVRAAQEGGWADVRTWRQKWFATVKGTPLESDEGRADWLDAYTEGRFTSLAEWLAQATELDANKMFVELLGAMQVPVGDAKAEAGWYDMEVKEFEAGKQAYLDRQTGDRTWSRPKLAGWNWQAFESPEAVQRQRAEDKATAEHGGVPYIFRRPGEEQVIETEHARLTMIPPGVNTTASTNPSTMEIGRAATEGEGATLVADDLANPTTPPSRSRSTVEKIIDPAPNADAEAAESTAQPSEDEPATTEPEPSAEGEYTTLENGTVIRTATGEVIAQVGSGDADAGEATAEQRAAIGKLADRIPKARWGALSPETMGAVTVARSGAAMSFAEAAALLPLLSDIANEKP